MTASISLDQFVHLKQPACDYLSQAYQISYHLTDLKEAIEELVFVLHAFITSGHKMLDRDLIPVGDLEALHLCQIQVIEVLRQASENIESYKGFESYSAALSQREAAHG